ncbi:ABC transporter ATP-binding protein [Pelomicrobium methylotrophicum]|uniref:ABC transporter ATP-binding protein n=1 Tax=Pelomicrobium methylotrophicum TaxID=2602750 RepID=UPI001969BBF8|nr:ABC transporter ATP-binding protein [Pelomicrobium methylotrophicum]
MSEAAQKGEALIELESVAKVYRKGRQEVRALDGLDLTVAERGMVAIVGPSGSGKSTLLHLIGAMDRPTAGEVVVAGRRLNTLPQAELTRFRRQTVGFVFQSFNLIPNLTALENVMLPMEFNGVGAAKRKEVATRLLARMGLAARLTHRPQELSGGEQQRVAIARALANDPPLILADEPTGNLDSKTGEMIYELLQEIARERTVVVVTHAETLARMSNRVLYLKDGRLAPEVGSAFRNTGI